MGQKLFEDKIGTLSHGGGIISLAPSRLTIGGQQYVTSTLQLTLPALSANRLHMLYAVQSGGVVSLVVSINVNSVGPAGYASWKLVGAFTTNYLLSFVKFLPIEGIVTITALMYQGPSVTINASVTGFLDSSITYDPYGINIPNAGAYTSSTGNYATTNPSLVNPIPGATVTFDGTLGWASPGVNSANTWNAYVFRNGVQASATAINGAGANAAGLNFLQCPLVYQIEAQAAGDFYSVKASNDQGAISTFIRGVNVEIIAPKQIKDM